MISPSGSLRSSRETLPSILVSELLDDLAALDEGGDLDAVKGAAVGLSDTITSWATSTSLLVRYPEFAVFRAVSAKPFPGAARGDEVLEHGEAFPEVARDRRLDDLARRLCHEAPHAGELPVSAGHYLSRPNGP